MDDVRNSDDRDEGGGYDGNDGNDGEDDAWRVIMIVMMMMAVLMIMMTKKLIKTKMTCPPPLYPGICALLSDTVSIWTTLVSSVNRH